VAIVLLAGILIYAVITIAGGKDNSSGKSPATSQQITVEGEYVCLPKTGSGPYTQECAFGVKVADDLYYALDFTQVGGDVVLGGLRVGDKVRITGVFQSVESIYVSEGVIEVASFEEL